MENFVRLPISKDRSLKAWSAVDEYLIKYIEEEKLDVANTNIFHDRYGYLTCHLESYNPITYTYLKSQEESILQNAISNDLDPQKINYKSILNTVANSNTYIIKIPKSLDLFRLYLIKISTVCNQDSRVLAGFMTRHFTKSMLSIAQEYFEDVTQSRAWKKSRLLILSNPIKKVDKKSDIINHITFKSSIYKQYLGVFSAKHIDYATQFLLENLTLEINDNTFLDLGCGNGIIGKNLLENKEWEEAILMDDSLIAIASSRLNTSEYPIVKCICDYKLDIFKDEQFDLVISNPPFHFEYEVDPSIAYQLMQDAKRILSKDGRLIIVANRHLNYKSHLKNWYRTVSVIAENQKFVIFESKL